MRVYIIGNDEIGLSREAPAALNEGEIVVASNEELHAAPLSGKQLLALWNALPGVAKRKKVGDRAALIDQLWLAIEALPDPEPRPDVDRRSKQDGVIAMLRRPEGATVDEVASATGWQRPDRAMQTSPRWTAKLPNWWIGRRANYGLPGGNRMAPGRLWGSVGIC